MKQVSYAKQTTENPNPIARFAHKARITKSIDYTCSLLPNHASVLDFGSGEGYFLKVLYEKNSEADLYGYDPYKDRQCKEFTQINNLDQLESSSLDIITAFEVCEHLFETEVHEFCKQAIRLLKDDGRIIISVPIMYGLGLIPKELNKIFLNRRKLDYTSDELFKVVLGRQIVRPDSPRHTHKGFDFRWLENILSDYFKITKKSFSPFDYLPWYVNSQCFFECSKHNE